MAAADGTSDGALMPGPRLVALLAGLAAAGLVQLAWLPANGDATWYVYVAGRMLDGDRPYVDLVDSNPPMILALSMVPAAVARLTGLSVLALAKGAVVGLIGASLALCWRLGRGMPAAVRQASIAGWAYLLMVGIGQMFGQREHLMLILVLPYAGAAAIAARGERVPRRLAVVVGLMAGAGFAIKPFFVPAAALVELLLAARLGLGAWRRPEALAIGGVFLAYAAAVPIGTPEYFDVARRFAPLYYHHQPFGPILWRSSWRLPLVLGGAGVSWALMRRRLPGRSEALGLLAVGLSASVYLNGKGWLYHWYPATATATGLVVEATGLAMLGLPAPRRRAWATFAATVMVPILTASTLAHWINLDWRDEPADRIVRALAGRRGEAVVVLSPWLSDAFPMVVETGATWGLRYPMLWQTGAFYAGEPWRPGGEHPRDAMGPAERRFLAELAADVDRSRPAVLIVSDAPPGPRFDGFDHLAYVSADPDFARLMAGYVEVLQTDRGRVFCRRDLAGLASAGPETRR